MAELLLDAMLGKLATYLRMCGHDAAYALDEGVEADGALLDWAASEDRQLVTRDAELAARAADGVLLASREVEAQLRELAAVGLDLELTDEPVRCGVCNGSLSRVGPGKATPAYAPDTTEVAVWRCRDCGQHFWRGSHWDDVARTLSRLG